jgi:hypothetical protein
LPERVTKANDQLEVIEAGVEFLFLGKAYFVHLAGVSIYIVGHLVVVEFLPFFHSFSHALIFCLGQWFSLFASAIIFSLFTIQYSVLSRHWGLVKYALMHLMCPYSLTGSVWHYYVLIAARNE